jgi:hypothetical protein
MVISVDVDGRHHRNGVLLRHVAVVDLSIESVDGAPQVNPVSESLTQPHRLMSLRNRRRRENPG